MMENLGIWLFLLFAVMSGVAVTVLMIFDDGIDK